MIELEKTSDTGGTASILIDNFVELNEFAERSLSPG